MQNLMGSMGLEGDQESQLMEMLMALMGGQQEPDTTETLIDEVQASEMVDLTGNVEDEVTYDADVGGDMMAQFAQLFAQ